MPYNIIIHLKKYGRMFYLTSQGQIIIMPRITMICIMKYKKKEANNKKNVNERKKRNRKQLLEVW